jgi:hypothetical protein
MAIIRSTTQLLQEKCLKMYKFNNYTVLTVIPLIIACVPMTICTTQVVSSTPVHGEVYSIQHYVIKFVSNLRQVGGFLVDNSISQFSVTFLLSCDVTNVFCIIKCKSSLPEVDIT